MNYFRYFPKVNYALEASNTSFNISITQISAHASVVERLLQNISVIQDFMVNGEERPDNVAERIYGSPIYTWVILLLNNITSLFDWPMNSSDFQDYIIAKYGSVENSLKQFVYRTSAGFVVDEITYTGLLAVDKGTVTSQYDEEITINDAKRRIKIVPGAFIPTLQKELSTIFQS
jgi:Base plate wedge protein 53